MLQDISICLIGKNEEDYIDNCLKAVTNTGLPICYTDTGSTDKTISIASAYTKNIFHFEWCNDFSQARNFCASKAETDWIWMIDCDEFLTSYDMQSLNAFLMDTENTDKIGTVLRLDTYPLNGQQTKAAIRIGRIYNRRYYHYTGTIHEQLTSDSCTAACQFHDFPITFDHAGYENTTLLRKKCTRNISLLELSLQQKEDPYIYYQLGKAYSAMEDYETARKYFSRGLEFDLDPRLYYVKSLVESYGYCLLELKLYSQALSFEGIYDTFADNADFLFLMGLIYMNNARFEDAVSQFLKATEFKNCIVEGTNSYRCFYNIGVIYECLGNKEKAITYYLKCGNFPSASERLEVLQNG